MINRIKELLGLVPKLAPYTTVRNEKLKSIIEESGFAIHGNVGEVKLKEFEMLYNELHDFKQMEAGGMFYSVYSQDLEYRKNVFDSLQSLLDGIYQSIFDNFKVVINSFIVKLAGPDSEFYLHQDSTGLDESKYSPLSVWIPLQDVDENNGCLFVVPKSHKFASPYRGISFEQPFDRIQKHVLKYAIPVKMKAGDILIFDNRILHNSAANNSTEARKVVMSGIFPKDAALISVYKDGANANAPMEIYLQDEDFLLKNTNFFIDCTMRPKLGRKIKEYKHSLKVWSEAEFDEKCQELAIPKANKFKGKEAEINCNIIAEPYGS